MTQLITTREYMVDHKRCDHRRGKRNKVCKVQLLKQDMWERATATIVWRVAPGDAGWCSSQNGATPGVIQSTNWKNKTKKKTESVPPGRRVGARRRDLALPGYLSFRPPPFLCCAQGGGWPPTGFGDPGIPESFQGGAPGPLLHLFSFLRDLP